MVFDFRFSQRCFTVRTPVNSFKTFVDVTAFRHFTEDTKLFNFKRRF